MTVLLLLPWLALLLTLPWHLRRQPRLSREPAAGGEEAPLVSVIVPARNEARNLGACVATLLRSSYPRFEVIIVDDRSRDGTREIAHALADRSDGRVVL
ncbi:MAG TPA: glycosyltransferase family A protein, partial [Longimicrobiales bacterium]|nr:glycosyltransferase family A protein [Longimicrobiales bacterium]